MKTIKVSKEMEEKIVEFCKDELNYHIYESGCADEYKDETDAELFLLRSLGYDDEADGFEEDRAEYEGDDEGDDENDKEEDKSKKEKRTDDEVLTDFIEDNLVDFVGYDCYDDPNGDEYNWACAVMEEYVEGLSASYKRKLASGIRNHAEDYYCEDNKIKKYAY